jgi:poly(beta-D-mannuronate) lyase
MTAPHFLILIFLSALGVESVCVAQSPAVPQRPVDPRLETLRKAGADVASCGLFPGAVHLVKSAADIRSVSGKLNPGDQLVLASGGDWKDARFTFAGSGTNEAPILFRPEKPGGVIFTGNSEVTFSGAHLIISGFEFKEVRPAKDNTVVFRLGNGEAKPADHCIVTGVKFTDCGSESPEDWPRIHLWLMSLRGSGNTIANSTFSGFRNIGQMIGAAELPPGGRQQLHILNNVFRDRPKIDEQNGYEIIQIGWSGVRSRGAGSLIQGNVFEKCDGETEIVTLKASDVVVRGNKFLGCQGALVLRHGDRVQVLDNVFDGQHRPNTGGVRVCGADHIITGNTFRDLAQPKDYYTWTISLMAASAENVADDMEGYGRVKNVLIANNRFEHCEKRIAAGIYPRPQYPLLPQNITVRDNVFTGNKDVTSAFDFIAPDALGALAKELHESGNSFQP